jgi:hypothetical protein
MTQLQTIPIRTSLKEAREILESHPELTKGVTAHHMTIRVREPIEGGVIVTYRGESGLNGEATVIGPPAVIADTNVLIGLARAIVEAVEKTLGGGGGGGGCATINATNSVVIINGNVCSGSGGSGSGGSGSGGSGSGYGGSGYGGSVPRTSLKEAREILESHPELTKGVTAHHVAIRVREPIEGGVIVTYRGESGFNGVATVIGPPAVIADANILGALAAGIYNTGKAIVEAVEKALGGGGCVTINATNSVVIINGNVCSQ